MRRVLRHFIFCTFLLGGGMPSHAGLTSYTDRVQIDFDTAMGILNASGTWSKIDGAWAFTPLDRQAPYTHGRWLYTEYGWYWKGTLPHSWVTEHYGYWKRGADKTWSWYPGSVWLPQTVEIRETATHIGWRSGAVDSEGNFVEAPIDRYSKPEEWAFVTRAQFANPITPAVLANADVTRKQLEESTDSLHTYVTYRAIDRPGPHPADFAAFTQDGGMLAPHGLQEEREAASHPNSPASTAAPPPSPTAATNAPTLMKVAPAPAIVGAPTEPAADTRQVKYWVTMSLPTYWASPPPDAPANEIYLYRPDFYQDEDGIARRIALWFNPRIRTSLKDIVKQEAASGNTPEATGDSSAAPASPAVPASPASDPFRSPLDEPFQGSKK